MSKKRYPKQVRRQIVRDYYARGLTYRQIQEKYDCGPWLVRDATKEVNQWTLKPKVA